MLTYLFLLSLIAARWIVVLLLWGDRRNIICPGIAVKDVIDFLGKLFIRDILKLSVTIDPTAIVAEGVLWHGSANDVLPKVCCTRDDDNAFVGEEVNANGDGFVYALVVGLCNGDEFAFPEALQLFSIAVVFSGNSREVPSDDLCRRIKHIVGVFVNLHKGFDNAWLLTICIILAVFDVCHDDLTSKEQLLVMLGKLVEVDAFEFGEEVTFPVRILSTERGLYVTYSNHK